MEKPENVVRGVHLIWASLAIWAVGSLVVKWLGGTSDNFMAALAFGALCCIFPYKIGNGSNAARYVYAVLTVVSFLAMAGGAVPIEAKGAMARAAEISTNALTMLIEVASLFYLFKSESSAWFRYQRAKA